MAAALSVRTTTTTSSLVAAALSLCIVISLSLRGADAARITPGDSPIVATCMTGPYPELCVGELGKRLLDVQTVIASAAPNKGAAKIAGAPGQVDVKALVSVALEAATEAGTILVSIFEGKLPGFNTSVPDFHKCMGNCSVTMKSAMQKLHGAKRPRCTRATGRWPRRSRCAPPPTSRPAPSAAGSSTATCASSSRRASPSSPRCSRSPSGSSAR